MAEGGVQTNWTKNHGKPRNQPQYQSDTDSPDENEVSLAQVQAEKPNSMENDVAQNSLGRVDAAHDNPRNREAANDNVINIGAAHGNPGNNEARAPATALVTTLPPTKEQLPNHSAYHECINGQEAEDKLRAKGGNCFLLRYSNNNKRYQLVVLYRGEVSNYKMNIDVNAPAFSLDGTDKVFPSLDELLTHFTTNPLSPSVRSIGKPCKFNKGICLIL